MSGGNKASGKSRFAVLWSSKSVEWDTPDEAFDDLVDEFGPLDLDPAASFENARCPRFFTEEMDGLRLPWSRHGNWLNPPYGRGITGKWVRKAHVEAREHGCLTVSLLPARTDTIWFHEFILKPKHEIRLCRGRLRFGDADDDAPFPSMGVIFKPKGWKRPQRVFAVDPRQVDLFAGRPTTPAATPIEVPA